MVLDPAPARLLGEDLLVDVHIIRPNAAEAEALTAVEVVCRKTARAAADNLIRRGVGAVVIGAPGGDLVVTDDHELWLPHLPVDVVDATGAGDAFAAALACSLAHGDDLPNAARFANAAAALATTKLGAQAALPRRHDVMQLLAPHRVESRAS